jgi:outer membrane protein assembly factor BamA
MAALADERAPPPDPMQGEPADACTHPPSIKNDLLEVPRLLLAPPRLLLKAIAFPAEAMANGGEKHHFSQRLYLIFTSWDGAIGVRPELAYQLSFEPFFGLTFFDNRLFGRSTSFDITYMMGAGSDLYYARVRMRPLAFRHATQLYLLTQFTNRNDQLYAGIGEAHRLGASRYEINAYDLDAHVRSLARPEVHLFAGAAYGLRKFSDGALGLSDPPISQVYCLRTTNGLCSTRIDQVLVPGFADGTQFLRFDAGFFVDTRDSSFRPSSGAVAEATVDYSVGLSDPSSYFRLRGSVMGVIDLWKRSHVLVLRAWGMGVFPTNNVPVPFTELVVLGGPDDLRGVRSGFYRDYAGLLFTAEYRWPLWMWMDATLFTDAGGVFGRGWSLFRVNQLKPDVGIGVRLHTRDSFLMRLQVAWSAVDGVQFFVAVSVVP